VCTSVCLSVCIYIYRSIRNAYRLVQDKRGSSGAEGLEGQIKIFHCLVESFRPSGPAGANDVGVDVIDKTSSTEQIVLQQHLDLATKQRAIQDSVAEFIANTDNRDIKSLQELPHEIKTQIQNRDLLRAKHAKDLKTLLQDLMQTATDFSKILSPDDNITSVSDLETIVLRQMKNRQEHFESQIEEGRQKIEAYNIQARGGVKGRCSMGARASQSLPAGQIGGAGCDENEIGNVTAQYDDWIETYLKNSHADKSDKAMAGLKGALTNGANVGAVLGFEQEVNIGTELQERFKLAGSAIARERQY